MVRLYDLCAQFDRWFADRMLSTSIVVYRVRQLHTSRILNEPSSPNQRLYWPVCCAGSRSLSRILLRGPRPFCSFSLLV
jgi:hypothetical protein